MRCGQDNSKNLGGEGNHKNQKSLHSEFLVDDALFECLCKRDGVNSDRCAVSKSTATTNLHQKHKNESNLYISSYNTNSRCVCLVFKDFTI